MLVVHLCIYLYVYGKEDSPWADEDPAFRVRAANLLVRVLIAFATPRWRQTEIRLRQ